jgi:hypothetical protein
MNEENIVAREANFLEAKDGAVTVTTLFGERKTLPDCTISTVNLTDGQVVIQKKN